jgi:hypothetical protein
MIDEPAVRAGLGEGMKRFADVLVFCIKAENKVSVLSSTGRSASNSRTRHTSVRTSGVTSRLPRR